jgi:hypothetical protein
MINDDSIEIRCIRLDDEDQCPNNDRDRRLYYRDADRSFRFLCSECCNELIDLVDEILRINCFAT